MMCTALQQAVFRSNCRSHCFTHSRSVTGHADVALNLRVLCLQSCLQHVLFPAVTAACRTHGMLHVAWQLGPSIITFDPGPVCVTGCVMLCLC